MEEKIQKTEMLYRAIKRSKPDWLDYNGKPTASMYKDEGGNSVDRDDNRTIEEVVYFMENGIFKNRLKGVIEISAGSCMDIGAIVVPDPKDYNPYHANKGDAKN